MKITIINIFNKIIKLIETFSLPAYDIYSPLKIFVGFILISYAIHSGIIWFYIGFIPLADGTLNYILFYILCEERNP